MTVTENTRLWRLSWALDGSLIGVGRTGHGKPLALTLQRVIPNRLGHGSEWDAQCRPEWITQGPLDAPEGHPPGHPDCTCGIYAVEHLASLRLFINPGVTTHATVRRWYATRRPGAEPPGLALAGVTLENPHRSPIPQGDPRDTWKGTRGHVVGPIYTTAGKPTARKLAARYKVEARHLSDDPLEMLDLAVELVTGKPRRLQDSDRFWAAVGAAGDLRLAGVFPRGRDTR